jgi:poly(A) polymerase
MLAADDVLSEQLKHVSIPKRFSVPMREIWMLQGKFERRSGKQAQRLFEHPRFRAAYDFLLLRAETGEAPKELAEWWTRYQEVAEPDRDTMTSAVAPSAAEGRKRRRRRRKKPAGGASPSP